MLDLGENPGIGHRRPAYHETRHSTSSPPQGILRPRNVAVPDDGDGYGSRHGCNHLPVGISGISLGTRPAMDGDPGHADALKEAGRLHGINRLRIPSDADFRRDRQRRAGLHDCIRHTLQERAIAQQ